MKKSYIALLFLAVIVSFFLYILSLLQAFPKIIALPLLFGIIVITLSYFNHKKKIQRVLISKISCKTILSVRKNKEIHLIFSTNIDIEFIQQKKTRIQSLVFFHYFSSNNNASNSFNFSSNTCSASFTGSGDAISTPAFFSTSIG